MVTRHGHDRISYSTLFDIGTCRGAATFAPVIAIGDDRRRSGGAPIQELQHELPITRANDRGFVVDTDHDRRRAARLCSPWRGVYRRRTSLCDSGTEQRALRGILLRLRSPGTLLGAAGGGAAGGGAGRRLRGGGVLWPERLWLWQRLWLLRQRLRQRQRPRQRQRLWLRPRIWLRERRSLGPAGGGLFKRGSGG